MRLNHSKLALGVPLLLGVALVSCNGDRAEVPSSDAALLMPPQLPQKPR